MSGSGAHSLIGEGLIQGTLYHWHFYRRPWRRTNTPPASEQLLDKYKWETSARQAPRSAGTSTPEGKAQTMEPSHRRLLSLPRFGTLPNPKKRSGEPGALQRIFLRSMSEPGANNDNNREPLRKVESVAERSTPSVSSFFSSLSRRIGKVLREEGGGSEDEGGEDGRGVYVMLVSSFKKFSF